MAGRIPQSFIDELMNRVDIIEVIDARVPLKKAGREYTACCPFHGEKTPSFTVSPNKQFYHCFGCGAHGTALGFLMEYEHLSFPEAIESLANTAGLEVPREESDYTGPSKKTGDELYECLTRCDSYYRQQLRSHPEAKKAVDYLKRRGLSGEIAAEFGIGFAPDGWDNLSKELGDDDKTREQLITAGMLIRKDDKRSYDRFRERIMFPIRDRRGRTIAFGGRIIEQGDAQGGASVAGGRTPRATEAKYLNSPETPVFHKGRELYGLFEASRALRKIPRLLVVEGYMDVVSAAQFGIRYAVATLGTATTREHLTRLFRICPELVFCFDGDRAGRDAAWRALNNALPTMREGYEIRFSFLPDGEDPDTRVRAIGKEAFEKELEHGKPFSEFFFDQLQQGLEMSTLDGRARLVKLAQPLLAQLPEGIYKHMMLGRLAELARTDVGAVTPEHTPQAPTRPVLPRKKPAVSASGTPVRTAIAALLSQPALAEKGGDPGRLRPVQLPGTPLLVELLELLQATPGLQAGALLERFREHPAWPHLAKLAAEPPLMAEEEGLETDFLQALSWIEDAWLEQSREALVNEHQGKLDAAQLRHMATTGFAGVTELMEQLVARSGIEFRILSTIWRRARAV